MLNKFLNVFSTDKKETTHDDTVSLVRLVKNMEIDGNVATHNYAWLEKDQQVKEHEHPDCIEYFFILDGKGLVYLDGKKYQIKKGDFIPVPQGVRHSLKNNDQARLEFTTLRVILD